MLPSRLAACALLLIASNAAATPTIPSIDMRPHGDGWRVSYRFEQPVHAFGFARIDRKGRRAELWRAVDGGFTIALVDGAERVARADGASFTHVQFDMPPRYVRLDKDYAPFSPFGDGGLLIHTGRLFACAERCGQGGASPEWQLTIAPPHAAHVVHAGAVTPGEIRFIDRDSGTMVYVGRGTPVDTPHAVAVIDAEFPAAAREQLTTLLPRLMDHFSARLGALTGKPMLFASHDASHPGSGYGHQGGTLPGQVFVHLYGRRPATDEAEFATSMSWFFAHEAAHLYQRYDGSSDDAQAWIHEGGADAKAARALVGFGLLDEEALQERTHATLEACIDGLGGKPLNASAANGTFSNYYQCGMLLQLAVDSAARRASAERCDLLCVWADFLHRVEAGAAWNQTTFLAAVAAHAGSDTAAFLHAVAESGTDREAMARGLAAAGLAGFAASQ